MRIVKFKNGLNKTDIINGRMIFIISPDNPAQYGDDFYCYIDCLNLHKTDIEEIWFLPAAYNLRHYLGRKKEAESGYKDFIDQHTVYINECEIPNKIIVSWQKLVDGTLQPLQSSIQPCDSLLTVCPVENNTLDLHCSYQKAETFIANAYENSKGFQQAIQKTIDQKISKLKENKKMTITKEHALAYLLEELAVTMMLKGTITYPGEPNPAIEYLIYQLPKELPNCKLEVKFKPYRIEGEKLTDMFTKNIQDEDLLANTTTTTTTTTTSIALTSNDAKKNNKVGLFINRVQSIAGNLSTSSNNISERRRAKEITLFLPHSLKLTNRMFNLKVNRIDLAHCLKHLLKIYLDKEWMTVVTDIQEKLFELLASKEIIQRDDLSSEILEKLVTLAIKKREQTGFKRLKEKYNEMPIKFLKPGLLAKYYYNKAVIAFEINELKEAEENLKLAKKCKPTKELALLICIKLGALYIKQKKFDEAVKSHEQSLAIVAKMNLLDTDNIENLMLTSYCRINLAYIYRIHYQAYTKATALLEENLQLLKQINNPNINFQRSLAWTYHNLTYLACCELAPEKAKQHHEAFKYYINAIFLNEWPSTYRAVAQEIESIIEHLEGLYGLAENHNRLFPQFNK